MNQTMNVPPNIIEFAALPPALIPLLMLLPALLLLSGAISAAETAMFALPPVEADSVKGAAAGPEMHLDALLRSKDRLLAAILLASNLTNIGIVIISDKIMESLVVIESAGWEFAVKVCVVTFLILLFGEIIPKIFAAHNSFRLALRLAGPVRRMEQLLRPLSRVLVRSGRAVTGMMARKKEGISIGDLSEALDITANDNQQERRILSGIVAFANTEVEEVMRPRIDIVALDSEEGFGRVMQVAIESGHSRIPVYEQSPDNITGVLYMKDILGFVDRGDGFEWRKYLRRPYFVPERKRINGLLEEFRSNKVHLGIVVDEYGSTLGLVTLEDILEEIVGEIADEYDGQERDLYRKIGENTYMFEGKAHIGELERALGLDEGLFDDVKGEAETVAGLLLELCRRFLERGDSAASHGVKFSVERLDGRRIDKVKVILNG